MITLPGDGFQLSVKRHNVDLVSLCDWIEATVVFDGTQDHVSKSDVIDVLCENGIYRSQDFASQVVDDAWAVLRMREGWIAREAPFRVERSRVTRIMSWQDCPAHSFFIALSLVAAHREWAARIKQDYIAQGVLFERVARASLRALGWRVVRTGWSSGSPNKIASVISKVAAFLREREVGASEAKLWVGKAANDAGLDMVCFRPLVDHDKRAGAVPICLMQCASGANWNEKLHTPDIEQWRKFISFSTLPLRGIAIPFFVDNENFLPTCVKVNGLVFDRYRLLSASSVKRRWLPSKLKTDLVDWIAPRVSALPCA